MSAPVLPGDEELVLQEAYLLEHQEEFDNLVAMADRFGD